MSRYEGNAAGDGFGLFLAATGAGDHVCVDERRIEAHKRDIVAVDIEDGLHVVLVCKAEERGQWFDVIDGRIGDWVDDLEEQRTYF